MGRLAPIKFCTYCGNTVMFRIPEGDNHHRYICTACNAVHYQNPRNVVGSIPLWEDRVLLCQRAVGPRRGFWTLPAGFLELDETLKQGAIRETREESGADVELGELFCLFNIAHMHQVHFFYLAQMRSAAFQAGVESLAVSFFTEAQIPWEQLAFPSVRYALECFFSDRKRGQFSLHSFDLAD